MLDAMGPRSLPMLKVACALAYSHAASQLLLTKQQTRHSSSSSGEGKAASLLRKYGDACNEVSAQDGGA